MVNDRIIFSAQLPNLEQAWGKVLAEGTKLEKPKGHILIASSKNDKKLYFLQKGEVSFINTYLDGRERLIGKTKGPALIGESSILIDDFEYSTALHLVTPCTLYSFTESWVKNKMIFSYPELTTSLIQSLSIKTNKLIRQRIFLRSDNLSALICSLLQQHLIEGRNHAYARTNLNQLELASFLGVHRVSLNKALRKLENSGIIGPYNKKETFILDMNAFTKIVDGMLNEEN